MGKSFGPDAPGFNEGVDAAFSQRKYFRIIEGSHPEGNRSAKGDEGPPQALRSVQAGTLR